MTIRIRIRSESDTMEWRIGPDWRTTRKSKMSYNRDRRDRYNLEEIQVHRINTDSSAINTDKSVKLDIARGQMSHHIQDD